MGLDRYEWYCGVDPGTTSVFGALFIAYDRYSSTPYVLDELYERRPQDCTVGRILPKILDKVQEFNPHGPSWHFFCDSAAAWFIQEAIDRYNLGFAPAHKRAGDKLEGISTIKDILLTRKGFISDRCKSFQTELMNYRTNDRGVPVKEWDHLIDIFRYFLKFAGYTSQESEYVSPIKQFQPHVRPKRDYTTAPHPDDNTVDSLIETPDGEFWF